MASSNLDIARSAVKEFSGGSIYWLKAQKAFKRKDYKRAIQLLLEIINTYGEHAAPVSSCELRTLAGVTLLRLQRTEEGVAQLEIATKGGQKLARAHYKLGLGYGRLKRQEEALAQFELAVEIEPRNVEYLCRMGLQLRRMGRSSPALAAYRAVLDLEPTNSEALTACSELKSINSNSIFGVAAQAVLTMSI